MDSCPCQGILMLPPPYHLFCHKAVSIHVTKAYWDSRGIAPLILNPGIGWRWVLLCYIYLFSFSPSLYFYAICYYHILVFISLFCYISPSCFYITAVSTPHFLLPVLCTSPSSYWSTNLLSPLHQLLLSYHPNPHLQFTFMIITHINWFHFFLTEYLFTTLRMSLRGPYPWFTQLLYTCIFIYTLIIHVPWWWRQQNLLQHP